MKKSVLLLTVLLLLVLTIPVAAYYQPIGEEKSVWSFGPGCYFYPDPPPVTIPEIEWDAEAPFYIAHGYFQDMIPNHPDLPPEIWAKHFVLRIKNDFELRIDGELITPTVRWRNTLPEWGIKLWVNVYEFKDGMTGTHVFEGTYLVSNCQYNGIPVNECEDVNELFISGQCTAEVTFTE